MDDFVWDAANIEHIAQHDVEPDEAEDAFADPNRLSREAYNTPTERRRAIIGRTAGGRLLDVVYTRNGRFVRIVTAHDAGPRATRRYERR